MVRFELDQDNGWFVVETDDHRTLTFGEDWLCFDGYEFATDDDCLQGLWILQDGEYHDLNVVSTWFHTEFDDLYDEHYEPTEYDKERTIADYKIDEMKGK